MKFWQHSALRLNVSRFFLNKRREIRAKNLEPSFALTLILFILFWYYIFFSSSLFYNAMLIGFGQLIVLATSSIHFFVHSFLRGFCLIWLFFFISFRNSLFYYLKRLGILRSVRKQTWLIIVEGSPNVHDYIEKEPQLIIFKNHNLNYFNFYKTIEQWREELLLFSLFCFADKNIYKKRRNCNLY